MRKFSLILFVALAIAFSTLGCGEDAAKGTLKVNIYGQEFVEDKIPHTSEDGYHGQGYEYIFTKFEVEIKDVKAHPEQGDPIDILTETKKVNLKPEAPTNGKGLELTSKEVPVGKYHLSFTIGQLHIEGSLQKHGGTEKEKKTFSWTINSETKYTECKEAKEGKGIREVTEGQTGTYQITIHADHILSAKLKDKSANPTWKIFSEQIVAADSDGNGEITKGELEAISLPSSEYESPANNLWGVMEKHAKIVGHVNGNGHCKSE